MALPLMVVDDFDQALARFIAKVDRNPCPPLSLDVDAVEELEQLIREAVAGDLDQAEALLVRE